MMNKVCAVMFLCILMLTTNARAAGRCPGDFDADGNVDGSDLAILAEDFGRMDCETSTTIKSVGPGEIIQSVIDSIVDASQDQPYVILILPGIHDCTSSDLILKKHVHLRGLGPGTTIIETHGDNNIIAAEHSSINDLTIRHGGNANSPALTENSLMLGGFEVNNVHFDIKGANKAFFTKYATPLYFFRNCKIVTEGIGLHFQNTSARAYLHGVDIILVGDNTTSPHIGILADADTGTPNPRIYYWSGRIGTGYGWQEIGGGGDQEVVAIWIRGNASNSRFELHDLESFCRLENAGPGSKINVIRAETGWIRCFGCFGQAESPSNRPCAITMYQSGEGKIELIGGSNRLSGKYTVGNTYGAPQMGVSTYTAEDDDLLLDKFQGGLILCDASDGSFTLRVEGTNYGTPYIFVKTDSSANSVIIRTCSADTIQGAACKTLKNQYDKLKIIRAANGIWYEH